MSPGKKLALGTVPLRAQASEPAIPAPIARHDQLVRGVEVWIYFRTWRRGVISRVIEVNRKLAQRGPYRGPRAIVMIDDGRLAVRRQCRELIPTTLLDDEPGGVNGHANRQEAQDFAGDWWAEHETLAPGL